jgi:hypothetical protein
MPVDFLFSLIFLISREIRGCFQVRNEIIYVFLIFLGVFKFWGPKPSNSTFLKIVKKNILVDDMSSTHLKKKLGIQV